jgi:CRP-like cAMP-binding protein
VERYIKTLEIKTLEIEGCMDRTSDVLKKSIVFSSLGEQDLDLISPLFSKRELHTGDVIATLGNNAQYCFILEKGTLLLAMEDGKSLVLEKPGDFAAMELLSDRGVYKTTITALEEGRVLSISRQAFLEFIQEDTPGAASIMHAWQEFLDHRAAFAKNIEDIDVPATF